MLALTAASATAQEAPVIINQETGAQVDIIRPYWNANVDIANRRIQCDRYSFNQESAVYEKDYDFEIIHNPMSESRGAPTLEHTRPGLFRYIGWTVRDGYYQGLAPLGNGQDEFVELVTYNTSSNVTQNNAVRVWTTSLYRDTIYHVCFDLDGAPLRPTGSAEIGNTDLVPSQSFSFQLPPSGTPVTATPEIVRLDTGEPVEFVRAEFDFNEDLAGGGVNCWFHGWHEESGSYRRSYKPEGASIVYSFPYAYTGGPSLLAQSAPDDFALETTETSVAGFMAHTVGNASFIEVDGSGYNMWGSSPLEFKRCLSLIHI